MNKRQKKKLKNRVGFFHYKSYKWRVRALYDMMKPIMACSMPYSFKLMMFEYAKDMLFVRPPKKICTVSSGIIPSMSVRMFGDKIHSFSIDADSFKNGYKPGELAVPLPKGPFDGYKSMSSVKLSAIHDNPAMVSAKLTIEHGDTNRMRRRIMAVDYLGIHRSGFFPTPEDLKNEQTPKEET